MQRIGVGIIGVNADRGWAKTAHIPALSALPQFEVRAISASNAAAAEAAGHAFGVETTLVDHHELVRHPDVDLVVVTVRAPRHRELVSAAIKAGKAVYCEWPLGVDLDEARAMANLARKHDVRTIIGLQARQAPQIQYARDLIRDGFIGEVLSTKIVGLQSTGDLIEEANAYMMDEANGANLLTVSVGHSVDALVRVLGEFETVSVATATRRPTVRTPTRRVARTSADQVAIVGRLASGAVVSVHIHEGSAGGRGFYWEIDGTEGTMVLSAEWALPEIFPLSLSASKGQAPIEKLEIPRSYAQATPELDGLVGTPAYNVGRTYASYASDLEEGTRLTADFSDAMVRHELIAALEASAVTGASVGFEPSYDR